jgi:hypothetical protein
VYVVQYLRQQASSYTQHALCMAVALRATSRLRLDSIFWLVMSFTLLAPHRTSQLSSARPATEKVWILLGHLPRS